MVERLGEDYDLTWEDVVAQTRPDTTVGRPHIADALVARGLADRSAAFASLLVPRSRYYVPHCAPEVLDAIAAVQPFTGLWALHLGCCWRVQLDHSPRLRVHLGAWSAVMERVVATFRIGIHDVDVVESLADEGSWFNLVVDGVVRDEILAALPSVDEVERIVMRRAGR